MLSRCRNQPKFPGQRRSADAGSHSEEKNSKERGRTRQGEDKEGSGQQQGVGKRDRRSEL